MVVFPPGVSPVTLGGSYMERHEVHGTIKSVKPDKGYGFLEQAKGSDLFFHVSQLKSLALDERLRGQRVEYDIGESRDGRPEARNVRAAI